MNGCQKTITIQGDSKIPEESNNEYEVLL